MATITINNRTYNLIARTTREDLIAQGCPGQARRMVGDAALFLSNSSGYWHAADLGNGQISTPYRGGW